MHYVKIYDKDAMPIGVVNLDGTQESNEGGAERHVIFHKGDGNPLGLLNIDETISEVPNTDVNIYDDEMIPIGYWPLADVVQSIQGGDKWVNPYPQAKLYLGVPYYIGEPTHIIQEKVVYDGNLDSISIKDLPDNISITAAYNNGQPLAMQEVPGGVWTADKGGATIYLPVTIFANGEKWFTITNTN